MPEFIAVQSTGVYRSSDDGQTWAQVLTSSPQSLAVSRHGDAVVAGPTSLLSSTDGGATWPRTYTFGTATPRACAANDAGVLLTAGYDASFHSWIRRSTDGVTWATPSVPASTSLVSVAINNAGKAIAGGDQGGILASADSGATWTVARATISGGFEVVSVCIDSDGHVIAGQSDGTVIISANAGATWTTVPASSYQISAIACDDSGHACAVDSGGGLLLSSDHGATWQRKTGVLPSAGWSAAFVGPGMIMIGMYGATAFSGDYGQTWTTANIPAAKLVTTVAGWTDSLPPLAPSLTAPSGVNVDRTGPTVFTWVNHPANQSPGSAITGATLRYRETSAATWTTVGNLGTTPSYTLPADTLATGNYQWEVQSESALGAGPWSLDAYFTIVAPTPAPQITTPSDGTVEGAAQATLAWSTQTAQAQYQVRIVSDDAGQPGATVLYDSGQQASTSQQVTVALLWNGQTVHLQVRYVDQGGIWSPYVGVAVQINYTPPATPTLTVTADDSTTSPTGGSILVTVTNPTPSGSQPTPDTNVLWVHEGGISWKAAVLGVNGSWRHWTPRSGVDTGFSVVASASGTGVQAESETTY